MSVQDGMNKGTTVKTQRERFFEYPEFTSNYSALNAMQAYCGEFEELSNSIEEDDWYRSDESLKMARERFQKSIFNIDKLLLKYRQNDYDDYQIQELERKKEVYQELIRSWTPEKNIELAKKIYSKGADIIGRYVFAYRDILLRETAGQESVVTPFFKELPEPIAQLLNKKVVYESRLKSWYSAVQKVITRMESLDEADLDAFYDIYGCSFCVTAKGEEGIDCCYKLANLFCRAIEKQGCFLLTSRYVGPTDDRVKADFRNYVKDYIKNPKGSGYKALHICYKVILSSGKEVKGECQITTSAFKHLANNKVAHDRYKKSSKIMLNWDFENLHFEDDEFIYSVDEDGEVTITDFAGILQHKNLTKTKIFRPLS